MQQPKILKKIKGSLRNEIENFNENGPETIRIALQRQKKII